MTRRTQAAALVLSLLAVPATAQAGAATVLGDTLVVHGTAGPEKLFLTGTADGRILLYDIVDGPTPAGCSREEWAPLDVTCPMPARLVVDAGAGDDWIQLGFDLGPALVAELDGGDGDDRVEDRTGAGVATLDGGARRDDLRGYGGDDVLRGGPGADTLVGEAGADRLEGGDGDDVLDGDHMGDPYADVLDGGPGTDTAEDWADPELASPPRIAISLDGVANDGRPGEGDDVRGVEHVIAHVSGTFTGSAAAEHFDVQSNLDGGDSTLRGGGGPDRLVGDDFVETIDGGPGDDWVEGGFNHDVLVGGPGRDRIYGDETGDACWEFGTCTGPFGNDRIDAVDGEVDTIDCGPGTDAARVDPIDVVAACEQVTVVGGGGGGGGGGGAVGRPAAAGAGARSVRALARGGLVLRVPCAGACSIAARLEAPRALARRLRLGRRPLALGTGRRAASGTAVLVLRPARPVARRLAGVRRARLVLRVRVVDAGRPTTTTLRLRLGR